MSNWHAYGQAIHPKEWWQLALLEYIKIKYPEKVANNPKVDYMTNHVVMYGMMNNDGRLNVSKKTIIETISPELN